MIIFGGNTENYGKIYLVNIGFAGSSDRFERGICLRGDRGDLYE